MMYPHDHDADAGHEPCERCGSYDDCGEACIAAYNAHREALRTRASDVRWLYTSCRLAMLLARRYRREEGQQGQREREALAQVRSYRNDIRAIRAHGRNYGIRQGNQAAE